MYFLRSTYPAHSTDSGSAGSESIIECQIRSNHLLKLVNLAEIFTGNSVYILEWIFVGLSYSRAILGISVPGVGLVCLPPPPPIYLNVDNMKPWLVITFGALHVWMVPNIAVKLVENIGPPLKVGNLLNQWCPTGNSVIASGGCRGYAGIFQLRQT